MSLPHYSKGSFKDRRAPTRSDGQWRAAQGRGDRRDGGKVGKRDAQSLPAHEQHMYACQRILFRGVDSLGFLAFSFASNKMYSPPHMYACLPPLLTASISESWCNPCSRARHHLSMECAHNANGIEGTKVRRCTNPITAPVQWGRNVRPRGPGKV